MSAAASRARSIPRLVPYDETRPALFSAADEIRCARPSGVQGGRSGGCAYCESGVGRHPCCGPGFCRAVQARCHRGLPRGIRESSKSCQAAGRVRGEPPTLAMAADYLVHLARSSHAGILLILDTWRRFCNAPSPDSSALDQLASLLLTVTEGPGLAAVLSVDTVPSSRRLCTTPAISASGRGVDGAWRLDQRGTRV